MPRSGSAFTLLIGHCLVATGARAQNASGDLLAVEKGAATYIRNLGLKGDIGFDEAAGLTLAYAVPRPSHRSAAHSAELARAMGARVVKLAQVVNCFVPPCRMVGVIQVVAIGIPAIKGDTALVWVHSKDGRPGGLTPISAWDKQLLFVRNGGPWRFVKEVRVRWT